jgi:hypothetical protein
MYNSDLRSKYIYNWLKAKVLIAKILSNRFVFN